MIELEETPQWIEEFTKTLEFKFEAAKLDLVHEI